MPTRNTRGIVETLKCGAGYVQRATVGTYVNVPCWSVLSRCVLRAWGLFRGLSHISTSTLILTQCQHLIAQPSQSLPTPTGRTLTPNLTPTTPATIAHCQSLPDLADDYPAYGR